MLATVTALTSLGEVVPGSWCRSAIRDACLVPFRSVNEVTSTALHNTSLPTIRVMMAMHSARVASAAVFKEVQCLLVFLLCNIDFQLLVFSIGIGRITQLVHLSTNILAAITAWVKATNSTIGISLASLAALSTGWEVVPGRVCSLAILFAVIECTCVLRVASFAVLLALLHGAVITCSLEELVEFCDNVAILKWKQLVPVSHFSIVKLIEK
jgi:hypothetical protein